MNELLILLGSTGVAVWVLYKLIHFPLKRCPRCKGTGTNPGGLLGRYKRCTRCGGAGEIRGWLGRKT